MMPAKPRTKRSKVTPPPPPTSSTPQGTSAPMRHRHSYSGPSTVSAAVKHAAAKAATDDENRTESADVKHEQKATGETSSESRSSFRKFIYTISFMALLLCAWWAYGMINLLQEMKKEVGWWGVIVGDAGAGLRDVSWMDGRPWRSWVWFGNKDAGESEMERKTRYVESSLNALADALGIQAVDVAHAVKPLVPSESLASIAAKAEETGQVMKILFEPEDTTKTEKSERKTDFEEDMAEEV